MIDTPTPRRRRAQRDTAPGLSDVARAAGVSTATASRALTRPGLVSDAVRERVRYAAVTLGYVANPAARLLATQRSGLVGVVLGSSADAIAVEALQAAESRLSGQGIGSLLMIAKDEGQAEPCARTLAARGVDGMLFVAVDVVPELGGWSSSRAVPSASIGQRIAAHGIPAADGIAWQRGLALAERYLADIGHLRIGIIRESGEGTETPRAPGHREPAIIERQVGRLHDVGMVRAAVRTLLQGGVTAVVAAGDLAAAAALRECRALDLPVPEGVSIVGWGDTALARCLCPTLTSVRTPVVDAGAAAADFLLAAMAGHDYVWAELPVKLVIRESSGPIAR